MRPPHHGPHRTGARVHEEEKHNMMMRFSPETHSYICQLAAELKIPYYRVVENCMKLYRKHLGDGKC